MDGPLQGVVTIATAIVGVAILAVLVSQRSNTAGVLGAAGNAFAVSLGAATAPVTGSAHGGGSSFNPFMGNPSMGFGLGSAW